MATGPRAVQKAPAGAPAEEENLEDTQPAKKTGLKKIIIISLVLLLLGAGGIATWFFMDKHKDAPPAAEGQSEEQVAEVKQEPPKPPVYINLEQFTVNLQPEGISDEFLQTTISLQVADQAQVDLIKLYMPQVRSRLLLLLSSKKKSEISTPEGKKKLADEIVAAVKQPFNAQSSPQAVSAVFFNAFVIQ